MAKGKGEFRNQKLGKIVYRQLKRQGPPQPPPPKYQERQPPKKRGKTEPSTT